MRKSAPRDIKETCSPLKIEASDDGRHKEALTEQTLMELLHIHATIKEICDFFGVSKQDLMAQYGHLIKEGRAAGKIYLRRAQFRNAVECNHITAQIWLGKVILGQSETGADDLQHKKLATAFGHMIDNPRGEQPPVIELDDDV